MKSRQRSVVVRSVAATTLCAFVITSCGGKSAPRTPSGPTGGGSPISDQVLVQLEDAPDGLDLRLSDGRTGPAAFDRARLAPAKKLPEGDVNALLARTRPIPTDPADAQAFALRPGSQPPPRTGNTIKSQFPAPPSSLLPPPANDAGKDLTVLRFMPEGAVPVAPELSVTFSQPMIAVTSQDDAAGTTPVKLTPQPKGRWRWIGTRTVLFDPEIRFPQATTYTVEVPAGTKSANGGVLKAPTKFTFETPAPTLQSSYPTSGPQHRDVPMFALFDQQIDPAAVLAKLAVEADGKAHPVELLSPAEIAKDARLAAMVESAEQDGKAGRWLAFRTTKPLPADAGVTVQIGEGTPSAEGPNKTKAAQRFAFRTYPPLRLERAECGYRNQCPPGTPFVLDFNNPLDADKFDETQLTITPAIPNVKIVQSYDRLMITGLTTARQKYEVRVSGGLVDEFTQTLGKDEVRAFTVTDAHPTFFGPDGVVVLDPLAQRPTLDFFSTNYEALKVRLYQVTPADYDAYRSFVQNQWNKDKPPRVPGKKVLDQLVRTSGGKNALAETPVDMSAALKNGLGHAIAIVEPYPWTQPYPAPQTVTWVQSTKLGLDVHVDHELMIAQVTELASGKPASGVALEMRPYGTKASTDDKGLAKLTLTAGGKQGANLLLARRGEDVAFVDDGMYWSEDGSWVRSDPGTNLAWYVVDDRKMYKPGEEVSLKGWLRTIDQRKGGDVGANMGVQTVSYRVTDSQSNEIAKGSANVSAVGGFDTKFTLPKTPNLGTAYIQFTASGRASGSHGHSIQIEEFRRPEFEVSATAGQGPFLVGSGGEVTVNAKYYSGGPLPGAAVNWHLMANRTSYTPPNRDDYTFGEWIPWWRHEGGRGGFDGRAEKSWQHASKTDATGAHTLHLDFLSIKPAMPMAVTANASVTDVNRQQWTASAAMIVHPSQLYVGVKMKRPFVEKGQPFDLDVVGVDLEGRAAVGAKIEVKAVRLDWKFKKGTYTTEEVDPQTCSIVAAKDASSCQFATREGGTYQVTATIVDAKGRPNQTKLEFWVTGGDRPPARDVAQETVQIIPDRSEYAAGNTAELLLQAPFYPAEGIVTWRRSGIVKTEKIAITGPTKVITVPIEDRMTPNLHVQIDLVGAAARLGDDGQPDPKLPKRPAYAVGTIALPIPPKQRTLKVAVAPNAAKVAPGEAAKLGIVVTDAAGRPAPNAEVAVLVVDEAILALTGYQFANPIDVFYTERGADTRDHYSRSYVKLAKPDAGVLARAESRNAAPAGAAQAPMAVSADAAAPMEQGAPSPPPAKKAAADKNDAGGSGGQPAIAIRSNFNPLAAFAPAVKTDASGRATVDVKMPDNLTRYRIVAIASAGDKQFGKGENAITARLPLMVRPSPPRFLNFGDKFQLPVVVQNQTDVPMTVKVAVRASNASITDGGGREVSVPANDRVEVLFPAAAALAGTARFQIVGASGRNTDAAELALPVWTPATTEAFATYGVIDEGAIKQPVQLPGAVVPQFGGLEVTTASTNLQALTDAMLYLVQYPYECSEQRASRILAIAALRDVLTAFKTKDMPSPAALEASVKADIERLSQMQNYDGGYAFWERGYPSSPYLSVFVTNALVRARAKGFTVPANLIERAKPYLKNIEQHYPAYYPEDVRQTISAFALYTRKLMGDLDVGKAQKLLAAAGGPAKVSMEANAWLLGTIAGQGGAASERKAIVRHALNKVSETSGAANFTTSYGDGKYLLLASDHRVDSVMLESLIQEEKGNDLIPKLVTGLLAHRKAGRWLNTQENVFALSAMDLYFDTYEKATPDFVARVWLGNDYAGDHAFKGRTTDYRTVNIAMKDVAAHDKQALTIQKDGKGRLYYRVGMTYAPADLKLAAADYGFVVQRRYEAVDDPKDVTRSADGTWRIKAGARVRVKLNLVNENRRYHVALVDPMPAGFEAMNPALAVTGPIPLDPKEQKGRGAYWWWYGPWYEHQNLRDERVEAFASLLWQGVHEYEYVARATTPGTFVVPPTKAEEMYMPETFGRSSSDRVIVE